MTEAFEKQLRADLHADAARVPIPPPMTEMFVPVDTHPRHRPVAFALTAGCAVLALVAVAVLTGKGDRDETVVLSNPSEVHDPAVPVGPSQTRLASGGGTDDGQVVRTANGWLAVSHVSGELQTWRSPDGAAWSPVTVDVSTGRDRLAVVTSAVAWEDEVVIGGWDADHRPAVARLTNGDSWAPVTLFDGDGVVKEIVHHPGGWVAVGERAGDPFGNEHPTRPAIWFSDDATTWTLVSIETSGDAVTESVNAVAVHDSRLLAVGDADGVPSATWVSHDGRSWIRGSNVPLDQARTVAATVDGFVALGIYYNPAVGDNVQAAAFTTDGVTWDRRDLDPEVFGNGHSLVVAIDDTAGALVASGQAQRFVGCDPSPCPSPPLLDPQDPAPPPAADDGEVATPAAWYSPDGAQWGSITWDHIDTSEYRILDTAHDGNTVVALAYLWGEQTLLVAATPLASADSNAEPTPR